MNGTVVQKEVFLDKVGDGAYHSIDLGLVKVKPDADIWAAPSSDNSKVKAIYLDRIFFVRE